MDISKSELLQNNCEFQFLLTLVSFSPRVVYVTVHFLLTLQYNNWFDIFCQCFLSRKTNLNSFYFAAVAVFEISVKDTKTYLHTTERQDIWKKLPRTFLWISLNKYTSRLNVRFCPFPIKEGYFSSKITPSKKNKTEFQIKL